MKLESIIAKSSCECVTVRDILARVRACACLRVTACVHTCVYFLLTLCTFFFIGEYIMAYM